MSRQILEIRLGYGASPTGTGQAGDGRLKRLAARDILDQHAKFRELDELTQRIKRIEERLEQRR